MNGESFSIGEAIGVGWKEVTGALGFWIAVSLIVVAASVVPDLLAERMGGWTSPAGVVIYLAGWILYFLVFLGFLDLTLRAVDGRPTSIGGLFARADSLVPYIIGSIIFLIGMFLGLILLVIPGIIVAVMWYFYGWAIVGDGAGGIESLGKSASLTKGQRIQVFLLLLTVVGVNLLGFLALLVGVLVSMPVTMVASAHVYRRLQAAQGAAPEAAVPGAF